MKTAIFSFLFIMAAAVLGIFGYCANVYKVFGTDFESPYKAEVIRTVGIFVPPVGVIAGYLTIED